MNTYFKESNATSKKYQQAAKGQTCTLHVPGVCKGNRKTVVLCHLESRKKGWGNKSPDFLGVDACNRCHDWLDRRRFKGIMEEERDTIILNALKETLMRRNNQGILKI